MNHTLTPCQSIATFYASVLAIKQYIRSILCIKCWFQLCIRCTVSSRLLMHANNWLYGSNIYVHIQIQRWRVLNSCADCTYRCEQDQYVKHVWQYMPVIVMCTNMPKSETEKKQNKEEILFRCQWNTFHSGLMMTKSESTTGFDVVHWKLTFDTLLSDQQKREYGVRMNALLSYRWELNLKYELNARAVIPRSLWRLKRRKSSTHSNENIFHWDFSIKLRRSALSCFCEWALVRLQPFFSSNLFVLLQIHFAQHFFPVYVCYPFSFAFMFVSLLMDYLWFFIQLIS